MGMRVSQDSGQLREIVEEIRALAAQFKSYTDDITTVLEKQVGESEGAGVSWYGPNAVAFLDNYKQKCPNEFTIAYNNIVSLSNNLEEQANAWETFEQTGV